MTRTIASLVVISLAAAGCAPDLGPCDSELAHRVVFDDVGTPAFEGQALMISACGSGGICHGEGHVNPQDRYGLPMGLEYDVSLAGYTAEVDEEAVGRLARGQERVVAHRQLIWRAVVSGAMPPGQVGRTVAERATFYRDLENGVPMPGVGTAEGRDILRNWLACEAPVVERTALVEDPSYRPVGETIPLAEVEPLMPNWTDIYTRLIEPRCNSAPCHGASAAAGLDLRDEAQALQRLMDARSSDEGECGDEDLPLLVPGDPEGSLFYQKLAGTHTCGGRRMPPAATPVSDASLEGIAAWISGL